MEYKLTSLDWTLYRDFATTDNQSKIVDLMIKHGNDAVKVSELMKMANTNVYRTLGDIKRKAEKNGFSPEHNMMHKAPDGFKIKGTSTLYDDEGNQKIQWVKIDEDRERQYELMREAIDSLMGEVEGKAKPVKAPVIANKDQLAIYNIGDAHVGLYAWAKEAGEDFNLDIAESDLVGAMKRLVGRTPEAKTALIIDDGDFFHSDNQFNETAKSGNKLDVDGRWSKVLQTGLMIMVQLVNEALRKHEKVIVHNAIGNHNDHSAVYLSSFLAAWFRKDKRVTVTDNPGIFWYHQFGKNLIGVTHGHTVKPTELGEIMAADCEDVWSESKYRYWYTGHIHHDSVKEYRTCKVESFRTLAAKDAWHSASGYRSGRDMKCIILHRDFGEVERHTVNVAMLLHPQS